MLTNKLRSKFPKMAHAVSMPMDLSSLDMGNNKMENVGAAAAIVMAGVAVMWGAKKAIEIMNSPMYPTHKLKMIRHTLKFKRKSKKVKYKKRLSKMVITSNKDFRRIQNEILEDIKEYKEYQANKAKERQQRESERIKYDSEGEERRAEQRKALRSKYGYEY